MNSSNTSNSETIAVAQNSFGSEQAAVGGSLRGTRGVSENGGATETIGSSSTTKNSTKTIARVDYLQQFLDDPKFKVDSKHAQAKWGLNLQKGTKVLVGGSKQATVVKTTAYFVYFVIDGNECKSAAPEKRHGDKLTFIEEH